MRYAPLLLLLLASACAKKTPPPAPQLTSERVVRCRNIGRDPLWQPGELRPAQVEVINLSADSVIVFLERCDGQTRVVDIGPRATMVVPLPDGASGYLGLLRFVTYRGTSRSPAIEVTPPEASPHVRLVLPAAVSADCPEVYLNGKRY